MGMSKRWACKPFFTAAFFFLGSIFLFVFLSAGRDVAAPVRAFQTGARVLPQTGMSQSGMHPIPALPKQPLQSSFETSVISDVSTAVPESPQSLGAADLADAWSVKLGSAQNLTSSRPPLSSGHAIMRTGDLGKGPVSIPTFCGKPVYATPQNLERGGKMRRLWLPAQGDKQTNVQDEALRKMDPALVPQAEIPASGRAATCALVSTAGAMVNSGLGKEIDSHEFVMRMNWGGAVLPVLNPKDFGKRTNILFLAHRDFSFCDSTVRLGRMTVKDACRACIPHALHPAAAHPKDKMQLVVVQLASPMGLDFFFAMPEIAWS